MRYLFLIFVLAAPVAIVAGLLCAYRKLSRAGFVLLLVLLAVPLVAVKAYERSVVISVVPDALEVDSIAYRKEESWGFGPGGNEAGLRVYPMKDHVAERVEAGGLRYLEGMPPNTARTGRRWRGAYRHWKETPITPDPRWMPHRRTGKFAIYDYVCRYGFCIDIADGVVAEAEAIVNSPGSYYAYGRIGVIVVSPARRKILYLYNG